MVADGREVNTLLEVASYEIIKQHEDIVGVPPTGLYFNKLISLTYQELREKRRIDIKLPHCWYRYGDEAIRYLMPKQARWNHETPMFTTVSWAGDRPRYEGDAVDIIREVVQINTEKYKELTKEELVDDVYALAPFDFQRNFRQLRLNVEKSVTANVSIKNYTESVLIPSLISTIKSFPRGEFSFDVASRITNYGSLMEQLLAIPDFNNEIALELTEDVWFYFSYYLRLHKQCHENIPRNVIEHWENQLDIQTDKFDRIFSEILVFINNNYELKIDEPLQTILNNRLKEKDEELKFIDEYFN